MSRKFSRLDIEDGILSPFDGKVYTNRQSWTNHVRKRTTPEAQHDFASEILAYDNIEHPTCEFCGEKCTLTLSFIYYCYRESCLEKRRHYHLRSDHRKALNSPERIEFVKKNYEFYVERWRVAGVVDIFDGAEIPMQISDFFKYRMLSDIVLDDLKCRCCGDTIGYQPFNAKHNNDPKRKLFCGKCIHSNHVRDGDEGIFGEDPITILSSLFDSSTDITSPIFLPRYVTMSRFSLRDKKLFEFAVLLRKIKPGRTKLTKKEGIWLCVDTRPIKNCEVCGACVTKGGGRFCCVECLRKAQKRFDDFWDVDELYTKERREKQSEFLSDAIKNGEFKPFPVGYSTTRCIIEGIPFRSKWEGIFWLYNTDLRYESLRIPYSYEGKDRTYIPDFEDQERKIIYEVKPSCELGDAVVDAKRNACESWCVENGYTFEFVTEIQLSELVRNDPSICYGYEELKEYVRAWK